MKYKWSLPNLLLCSEVSITCGTCEFVVLRETTVTRRQASYITPRGFRNKTSILVVQIYYTFLYHLNLFRRRSAGGSAILKMIKRLHEMTKKDHVQGMCPSQPSERRFSVMRSFLYANCSSSLRSTSGRYSSSCRVSPLRLGLTCVGLLRLHIFSPH